MPNINLGRARFKSPSATPLPRVAYPDVVFQAPTGDASSEGMIDAVIEALRVQGRGRIGIDDRYEAEKYLRGAQSYDELRARIYQLVSIRAPKI